MASSYAVILYAIVLIAMCCLTAKDLYPLCTDYVENNIATEIHVNNGNQTDTQLPSLVLCVPNEDDNINGFESMLSSLAKSNGTHCFCNYPDKANWTGYKAIKWSDYNSATDYQKAVRGAFLKELFYTKIYENGIYGDGYIHVIVDVAWDFFSCLTKNDVNFPNVSTVDCMSGAGPLPEKWRTDIVLGRLLRSLATSIKCYETSTLQTCANSIDNATIETIVNQSTLMAFEHLSMCFVLPQTPEAFSMFYRSAFVRRDGIGYKIFEDAGQSFVQLLANSPYNTNEYRTLYKSPPQPPTGTGNIENVTLQYRIGLRVAETRSSEPCYPDRDLSTCILNCRLKKIVQICGCVPFTFRRVVAPEYQSLPYCDPNSDLARSCSEQLPVPDLIEKCKAACGTYPCSFTYYDWLISSSAGIGTTLRQGLSITVSPTTAPALEFNIVYKDSVSSFIANVGGIANFYLGIDGLMLCGILIAMVNSCLERRRAKHSAKTTPGASVVTVGQFATVQDMVALKHSCAVTDAQVQQLRLEVQALTANNRTRQL